VLITIRNRCRPFHLKFSDDLLAALEREAKARRVPKSALVRESLEALLWRPGRRAATCFDPARDLAGSVKGLPQYIAHNPKYMERFRE